jgi:hypothetical protein
MLSSFDVDFNAAWDGPFDCFDYLTRSRFEQASASSPGRSPGGSGHWEQGRRVPEGPTRAYLLVIDRKPKPV